MKKFKAILLMTMFLAGSSALAAIPTRTGEFNPGAGTHVKCESKAALEHLKSEDLKAPVYDVLKARAAKTAQVLK